MPESLSNTPSNFNPEAVLAEANRQYALDGKKLTTILSDADLLELLVHARRTVDENFLTQSDQLDIKVPYTDPENGQMTGLIPRKLILILAELYHLVRDTIVQRWEVLYPQGPQLLHPEELPSASFVDKNLSEEITRSSVQRVQEYVRVALALEQENIVRDIMQANAPTSDVVQGSLHINGEALQASELIISGVQSRLLKIFNTPPVHIVRSMREWRNWEHLILTATEADVPDIHQLYNNVLMPRERLVMLDPRYARQSDFISVADEVRNHGAMFKALKSGDSSDEVFEGIRSGRIAIIRDEPQDDALDQPGELLGFYNVVSEPDAVRAHMKQELHFSKNLSYTSTADLPRFSRVEELSGEMRTIAYIDEENALRVFRAAADGSLAWSVDHAVRMDGLQKLQRYAMMGTALKIDNYQYMRNQAGKSFVLMKIATVVGADSSVAATEFGIEPIGLDTWQSNGGPMPYVDQSKMVVLPRAISNVGSKTLNVRLGAHEVFTVTEEFIRDGVRVRILWHYLAQPLPPDIP